MSVLALDTTALAVVVAALENECAALRDIGAFDPEDFPASDLTAALSKVRATLTEAAQKAIPGLDPVLPGKGSRSRFRALP